MLRFLFFALAFVAALMAFVLDLLWLYAVAAGLVAAALVALVVVLKKQHTQSRKAYASSFTMPSDDMTSLGILEIRPKVKAPEHEEIQGDSLPAEEIEVLVRTDDVFAENAAVVESPALAQTRNADETELPEWEDVIEEAIETREIEALADDVAMVEASDELVEASAEVFEASAETFEAGHPQPEEDRIAATGDMNREAQAIAATAEHHAEELSDPDAGVGAGGQVVSVNACLRAVQTALGAHTVCLLKQRDFDTTYTIEGIVGKANLVKPSGRSFIAVQPLITEDMLVDPVGKLTVADGDFHPENLGYYTAPVAIQEVLFVIVRSPERNTMYFLLADTIKEKRFDTPRARALMLHFGHAIGVALQPSEQDVMRKEKVRSRREIIAEEMVRARANKQPLALALVHLNGDEVLAAQGESAILAAEKALEDRLRQATLRRGRVERFGELTYGVLFDGTADEVEVWACDLRDMLAQQSGVFEHGVSIGAAVLHESHESADAFRADATEAVTESYHSGACIIFG